MITYRQLSPSLRLAVTAPWCLLLSLAVVAATPAARQLLLDPATNQPTSAVSLSGPRWTGTLDAARLPDDPTLGKQLAPASVAADGTIQAGDYFATRSGSFVASDTGLFLNGYQAADPYGDLFAASYLVTPAAYVGNIGFADGSQLTTGGTGPIWTDPSGVRYSFVAIPMP